MSIQYTNNYGKIQNNNANIHEKWIPKVSYSSVMLKGIQEESQLSFYFFSNDNVEHLQWLIRQNIYELSQGRYKIDNQDQDELLIIMRSIYLEYSINGNVKINQQIRCLNKKVLEFVCPQILSSVRLYEQYLKDSSQPHKTMDLPRYESMSGTKSYDLSRFI
jgi:hypothetical protein